MVRTAKQATAQPDLIRSDVCQRGRLEEEWEGEEDVQGPGHCHGRHRRHPSSRTTALTLQLLDPVAAAAAAAAAAPVEGQQVTRRNRAVYTLLHAAELPSNLLTSDSRPAKCRAAAADNSQA